MINLKQFYCIMSFQDIAYQNTQMLVKPSFDCKPSRDCWCFHHTDTDTNHSNALPHILFSNDHMTLCDVKPEPPRPMFGASQAIPPALVELRLRWITWEGRDFRRNGIIRKRSLTVCHAPPQVPWNPFSQDRHADGRDPRAVPTSV